MDVLVVFGVGVVFVVSLWVMLSGQGEVYFDLVIMFVFLLFGGCYFEMMVCQKVVCGIEVINCVQLVLVFCVDDEVFLCGEVIVVVDFVIGDLVLVKLGECVLSDGEVCLGSGSVDELLLSGESWFQFKQLGL